MSDLAIKIKIGEREYPMRVSPSEEERLRIAGKLINEKLRSFRDAFKIDDKEDLLAMVAFDCMVEKLKSENSHKEFSDVIADKIQNLNHLIEFHFRANKY